MGTSRGYGAPTGGGWPALKRLVNQFGAGSGGEGPAPEPPLPIDDPELLPEPEPPLPLAGLSPAQLLARYVRTLGDAGTGTAGGDRRGGGGEPETGGGSGGRSARGGIGASATRVGQNLGQFASRVREAGLAEALREFNLGDLVGRPAGEVLAALVDRLCGPGSTMDEDLAISALNDLRQEWLSATKTFEDVERRWQEIVRRVDAGGLVVQFYGQYLYRMFCRDFYEGLRKKVGRDRAHRSIESVRRTIRWALRAKIAGRDPAGVDWRGAEGRQLADSILRSTLQTFEVAP